MVAEAFRIEETTGAQRLVELSGRALPYWVVSFPGEQHLVQTWYQGNPEASIQVMGPRLPPTECRGKWKTRYLAAESFVRLRGFDDLGSPLGRITAEELVEVFQRLRRGGNELLIQWGQQSRRGVMKSFVPTYDRAEDIAWTLRIEWVAEGETPRGLASVPSAPPTLAEDVTNATNAVEDSVAAAPPAIPEAEVDQINAQANVLRDRSLNLTAAINQIQGTANVVNADVQRAQAYSALVVQSCQALQGDLSDLPYTEFIPVDTVESILSVEEWRRSTGVETRSLQYNAYRSWREMDERLTPGTLAIISTTESQSLRRVAQIYYGDADSWPVIADANGIVGSSVPAGTRLVIPRPPASGQSASV